MPFQKKAATAVAEPQETPAAPARTYTVAGMILHNKKPYFKGDVITFDAQHPAEEIQELLDLGQLDGPKAREIAVEREVMERSLGFALLPMDEQKKFWQSYVKRSPAQQRVAERQEARIKEDGTAARLANEAEGAVRHYPDEDLHAAE